LVEKVYKKELACGTRKKEKWSQKLSWNFAAPENMCVESLFCSRKFASRELRCGSRKLSRRSMYLGFGKVRGWRKISRLTRSGSWCSFLLLPIKGGWELRVGVQTFERIIHYWVYFCSRSSFLEESSRWRWFRLKN
jgi:hypothetical protein